MKKEELIKYANFNEEDLPLRERMKLAKMTKKEPDLMTIILFNKQPNFLREYEKVYFAKYLNKNYTIYEGEEDVYIAPESAAKKDLTVFSIPEEELNAFTSDEYYEKIGIGYRDVRVYSMIPGMKYKLMKGEQLTGYPSFDKPWELTSRKIDLESTNLLEFYEKSRRFLGPKKCKYAFQAYDQKVTWEEFEEMVNKYVRSLTAAGVKSGDVVPVCITGTIEATALYFACDTIGAATFFIDPNETNIETINKYFNRFNAKVTFTMCSDLEKINQAIAGTGIKNIFVASPTDSMNKDDNISKYSKEYIDKHTVPYNETDVIKSLDTFIKMGENYTGKIEYCRDNSHISLITSTSSSTGDPKLIELSRENIMFELEIIKKTTLIHLGPNGVNMQVVPFKYPYGFVVSTLISAYVGKTAGLTPDFSLQDYVKFIEMYKPAYMHLVPSIVKNIINNPELQDWDWSFLKYIICGGDKYETAGKEYANNWFKEHNSTAQVKDASGAAEVTAGITAATVGKYNVESVGKPMIGTIVKAVDENGNELPYGHVGKLCYYGKNVMQRYNNDKEKTDEVLYTDKEGRKWVVTDSYGFIDQEGFVYMCGRDRDFFITFPQGKPPYKVYTDFVEKIINSCDEVFECVVVKKPDDQMDCVPKAFIVLKPDIATEDYDSTIMKIRDKCLAELDECAVPVSFDIVPVLKTKPSLKVDKQYYMNLATNEYEREKKAGEITK